MTASVRVLFGNPNPSGTIDTWPMQHPTQAALAWTLIFLVVFIPLAVRLYRRATLD